jgi:hypothetical protein
MLQTIVQKYGTKKVKIIFSCIWLIFKFHCSIIDKQNDSDVPLLRST